MWLFDPSAPWELALNVVWRLESPQSTSTDQGSSFVPGSENEPRSKEALVPSLEFWSEGADTDGATLWIATVAVYSVVPPSLSRIFPPTARLPLSVVGQLPEFAPPNAP